MSAKPRRRRWWIWLLAAGPLFLGAPALLIWSYSLDEPPPDDADLLPARAEVPEGENAFEALRAAHQLLRWPDGRQQELRDMVTGGPWDAALAGEFLDANGDFYEEFERALGLGRMQAPRIVDVQAPRAPILLEWREMANLCSLMARSQLEAGDASAALAWGLKNVRLSHLIENDEGLLLHFMMGNALRRFGLARFREAVEVVPDVTELLEARRELERHAPSAEILIESLKAEYQDFSAQIDRVSAGELPSALQEIPDVIPARLALRPNQTRRLMAQVVRDAAASARGPWSERRRPEGFDSDADSMWNLLLGNPSGKMIVSQTSSFYEKTLEWLAESRFEHDATRLLIALRAYQLEEGALPGALDELVPRHIDAVPADPFDGKPMRYSAERRVIYSVGDDLRDDGGAEGQDSGHPSEPTVRIRF